MPRHPEPGDCIRDYKIQCFLSQGPTATSHVARTRYGEGEKVFFKRYTSPTPPLPWYKAFVEYQAEFKRRIQAGAPRNFCYKLIDFFEEDFGGRTYFQTFEFVEGHDLQRLLDDARGRPNKLPWQTRLTFARVLMAGVSALHDAKVVHCDLKPHNVQLFADESIEAKYQLKLIDMDRAILADRQAPWHGREGYLYTPNYASPEHLRGEVPQLASDVFTCGLMLYELLGGIHPYASDEEEQYKSAALKHHISPPALLGKMPAPAADTAVQSVIRDCLSVDPARRPTARDVNLTLNGRACASYRVGAKLADPSLTAPRIPSAIASARPEPTTKITLSADSGQVITFGVRTPVGNRLCRVFGPDSQYLDASQFILDRDAAGHWTVHPNIEATNETLLNGKAIVAPTPLRAGDILSVGREAKKIVKLPLIVRFV